MSIFWFIWTIYFITCCLNSSKHFLSLWRCHILLLWLAHRSVRRHHHVLIHIIWSLLSHYICTIWVSHWLIHLVSNICTSWRLVDSRSSVIIRWTITLHLIHLLIILLRRAPFRSRRTSLNSSISNWLLLLLLGKINLLVI